MLWGPESDRTPPKASATVHLLVQALGFWGGVACEWGYATLTYLAHGVLLPVCASSEFLFLNIISMPSVKLGFK